MRSKHLDGDCSVEPNIPCAIHFTHASSTQRTLDFVGAEFHARGEGHGVRNYSLCCTLHMDATTMDEWSANRKLCWSQNHFPLISSLLLVAGATLAPVELWAIRTLPKTGLVE